MMKQELAYKILVLFDSAPDFHKIMDLLNGYSITAIDESALLDYQAQLSYFLGAKRTEGLSPKTIDNYRLYLEKFGGFTRKKAEDIHTNDVRRFIAAMGDSGVQKSTLQSVINILRSFFSWLTVEEIIPKNPMLRIQSFKLDRTGARQPLTAEELERLRNACADYREKALLEFLYSSGCRLSEALQINTADIDFERRTVQVTGKGNKTRTLYFSVRARLMIQEYILNRKGGEALFAGTRAPYDWLGARGVQKIIADLGKRAGIVRKVHPHILRHTFATNALNAGMDITVIQTILGHSSVSTTQIYARTNQEHVRQQHDIFVA